MVSTYKPIQHRIAIAALFFSYGLCFASWASRIPTIQQKLHLSDATLGGILLALPTGLFVSLPISGWAIAKFGSRKIVIISALLYCSTLLGIGFAETLFQLLIALFLFGFFGNILNIAVNTQAVGVEALYTKPIMASFHGMWSLAGFTGATIGTFMIGGDVSTGYHYLFIWMMVIICMMICIKYLLWQDAPRDANQPIFSMPEKSLLSLGFIAFCSMICEGAMFDWSGVYFKKVVQVEKEWIGAGYTAFMITMAGTRFVADYFTSRFGLKRVLQCSGLLTAIGLAISVINPTLTFALIGFLLVGVGVSSVVPLVYSAVGKSKTLSPGVAIAAVSTLGFSGLLIGPPIIGFISELTSLRGSFSLIAIMGLCVTLIASKAKY